jgi:threonine dehydrogenase-like Zn-dependent dehydrogenase
MNKGIVMRMGQCNVKRYMPLLLEHVRSGALDAKGLITHRFPLEYAPDAYRLFAERREGVMKCVLVPHDGVASA